MSSNATMTSEMMAITVSSENKLMSNVSSNNDTDSAINSTSSSAKRDEDLAKMEIIVLILIFILIIIGNSCVLIALAAKRFKMTRMYYFLLHLCISDLITGCCTVLPQIAWDITYRFKGGNILCKFVKTIQLLGPYLSSYVLVVNAIDRYQAICFPLTNSQWTSRQSKLMITIAWCIAIVFSSPQAFFFSYQEIPYSSGESDCWGTFPEPWGEKMYVTWYAISIFFIPLFIITYTYVYICREVWANVHQKRQSIRKLEIRLIKIRRNWTIVSSKKSDKAKMNKHNSESECKESESDSRQEIASTSCESSSNNVLNPRSHSINRISKAKIKTVKVTVVVVICYIVCSSPFILVQLWACWYPNARYTAFFTGPIATILMLLSSLNSTVNPWIYLLFNQTLMNALFNFCCCGLRRRKQDFRSIRISHLNSTCDTRIENSDVTHTCL